MELPINKLLCGDCVVWMKTFPAESIDCIVTDPPYGYSFMGKDWDKAVPSVETWRECLRVLKSGAFMFVMSAPRQDVLSQMIVRLGQAGFETGFTSIYWAYASGFPKAMNISLQVDKRECFKQLKEKLGREPTKEEFQEAWKSFRKAVGTKVIDIGMQKNQMHSGRPQKKVEVPDGVATSDEAKALDGSYGGFQPKPAVEVIIVAMKPLSEKTYVDQALKNGKGVTWLDNGRIPHDEPIKLTERKSRTEGNSEVFTDTSSGFKSENTKIASPAPEGRFPANLLVSDDVLNDGKIRISAKSKTTHEGYKSDKVTGMIEGVSSPANQYDDSGSFSRYFDLDKWWQKKVEELPEEVKKTFPFLICPKASKSERNKGCENLPERTQGQDAKNRVWSDKCANCGLKFIGGEPRCHCEHPITSKDGGYKYKNFHPTVKPIKLMSYLITLGSREGDAILDPFVGSGTTCIAAQALNRKWLGIEISGEYCKSQVPVLVVWKWLS